MTIEEAYQAYLSAGANPAHAMSLQTAKWLDGWITEQKPERVLDIGSGFSSYVLRSHEGTYAWSVEEDASWADYTRKFLAGKGLDAGHVFDGLDFRGLDGKFDLVLLDSKGEVPRIQRLRKAAALVKDGGTLIVDDGHFPSLHRCCKVWAKIQGYEFADLKELKDDFGRWPMRLDITQAAKQQPVSVVVAIPRAIVCLDEAFLSFMRIAQQGWALADMGYTMIPYARETFARHLLEHPEFTHTVMLDQDHAHPPDIVHRLAKRADEDRDKWVIGALNYRRGPPHDPVGYWDNGHGKLYTVPPAQWGTEMRTVDVVGLSASIIARECFEAFGPPWFDMDWSGAADGSYPGEDTCFSQKASKAGVKLWVDPTICSPHLKVDKVDRAYHERWVREHPEEIDEDGNIAIDKRR